MDLPLPVRPAPPRLAIRAWSRTIRRGLGGLAAAFFLALVACAEPPLHPSDPAEQTALTGGSDPYATAPDDAVERALRAVVGVRVGLSWGSGVIIDPGGVVLTASHVLDGASAARVTLWDGRRARARVVLDNETGDYAVLRIEAGDEVFPCVVFGEPPAHGAGLSLLAMTPDELSRRADGVVLMRRVSLPMTGAVASVRGAHYFRDAIIHSAAGQPGDSGGALVDRLGRLVGINVAFGMDESAGRNLFTLAVPAAPFAAALPALTPAGPADSSAAAALARLAADQRPLDTVAEVEDSLAGLLAYAADIAPERAFEAGPVADRIRLAATHLPPHVGGRQVLAWTWREFLSAMALPDPLNPVTVPR